MYRFLKKELLQNSNKKEEKMEQKQNKDKLVGYVILLLGLCIMGFSIISMISVFISGGAPINIFPQTTNTIQPGHNSTQNEQIGLTPLFPMFNIITWFVMAFIIQAAGGRVASLGIKMLKASLPDVITIKETPVQPAVKKE
jgi:hypothetical protein